jgi:hypothetical protein
VGAHDDAEKLRHGAMAMAKGTEVCVGRRRPFLPPRRPYQNRTK